jgi:hypothetical protein
MIASTPAPIGNGWGFSFGVATMSERFFDLRSPRDMLKKAEREHARLNSDLSVDNIFNFFVTAFHIKDYVESTRDDLKQPVKDYLQDEDFVMCRFICNKGKHLKLTFTPDRSTEMRRIPPAVPGAFCFNQVVFNGGPAVMFYVDGKEIRFRELAARVLEKWRAFFDQHKID